MGFSGIERERDIYILFWLVVTGTMESLMTFHSVGNFIIPTDELHHFSEGYVYHQLILYIVFWYPRYRRNRNEALTGTLLVLVDFTRCFPTTLVSGNHALTKGAQVLVGVGQEDPFQCSAEGQSACMAEFTAENVVSKVGHEQKPSHEMDGDLPPLTKVLRNTTSEGLGIGY